MHKAANKVARIVSSLAQALASRDRKADGCVLALHIPLISNECFKQPRLLNDRIPASAVRGLANRGIGTRSTKPR